MTTSLQPEPSIYQLPTSNGPPDPATSPSRPIRTLSVSSCASASVRTAPTMLGRIAQPRRQPPRSSPRSRRTSSKRTFSSVFTAKSYANARHLDARPVRSPKALVLSTPPRCDHDDTTPLRHGCVPGPPCRRVAVRGLQRDARRPKSRRRRRAKRHDTGDRDAVRHGDRDPSELGDRGRGVRRRQRLRLRNRSRDRKVRVRAHPADRREQAVPRFLLRRRGRSPHRVS